MQFFLRNPRGAGARALDEPDLRRTREYLAELSFAPIVAHAPYTLNLCSTKGTVRELSIRMLAEDLERMEHLPGNYYNLHPGCRLDQDIDRAIERIAEGINAVLKPRHQTMVLLETMSGKGTEIGGNFQELRAILEKIESPDRVGVCFDACHLFASGYDIANDFEGVLAEFDAAIGLDKLRGFHLNDSVFPFNSHKDRHSPIGRGEIGIPPIIQALAHTQLREVVFITETPLTLVEHREEIAMLKKQVATLGRSELSR